MLRLQVLIAISIHKSLVAFCLGLELAVASPGRAKHPLIFMFIFALISPIGIGIGIAVESSNIDELAQTLVSAILQVSSLKVS